MENFFYYIGGIDVDKARYCSKATKGLLLSFGFFVLLSFFFAIWSWGGFWSIPLGQNLGTVGSIIGWALGLGWGCIVLFVFDRSLFRDSSFVSVIKRGFAILLFSFISSVFLQVYLDNERIEQAIHKKLVEHNEDTDRQVEYSVAGYEGKIDSLNEKILRVLDNGEPEGSPRLTELRKQKTEYETRMENKRENEQIYADQKKEDKANMSLYNRVVTYAELPKAGMGWFWYWLCFVVEFAPALIRLFAHYSDYVKEA